MGREALIAARATNDRGPGGGRRSVAGARETPFQDVWTGLDLTGPDQIRPDRTEACDTSEAFGLSGPKRTEADEKKDAIVQRVRWEVGRRKGRHFETSPPLEFATSSTPVQQ